MIPPSEDQATAFNRQSTAVQRAAHRSTPINRLPRRSLMLLSLTLIVLGTLIARAQVPAALGEMCSAAAAGRGGTVAERLHAQGHLWIGALAGTPESETRKTALDLVPAAAANLTATDINLICEAFSDVVDAKSSFTYRHSMGVTEAAVEIASGLGLSEDRARLVKRAALLHDLGKLRVPNSILDKPGKLDGQEWSVVQEHPRLTGEILSRIGNFGELASVAAGHHEKLDGSGYPHRLVASQLPIETRIIAVADVYGALTENRPYRGRYAD